MTPSISPRALAFSASLLFIYGAKCWTIANYASVVPFWDEWTAGMKALYRPYLAGTLHPFALLDGHNEHRILTQRLLHFVELTLNRGWDPLAEMLVNAVIHIAALGLLLGAAAPALGTRALLVLCALMAVLVATPFGWENVLNGFQSQFYFLILFGVASLLLLYEAPAWSARWWLGTLAGIASFFSMAGGATTLVAAAILAVVQIGVRHRAGAREWLAAGLHLAISAAMVADAAILAAAVNGPKYSIAQWFDGALFAAGWPVAAPGWPAAKKAAGALAVQAPLVVLAWRLIAARAPRGDRRWLILVTGLWIWLQIVVMAKGRATGMMAPRYFDIYTIAVLANAAALLALLPPARSAARRWACVAAALWFAVVIYGAGRNAARNLAAELAEHRRMSEVRAGHLMAYVASGDIAHLRDKPMYQIPHWSADTLTAIVDDPVIRPILPPEIFGQLVARPIRNVVLRAGPLAAPAGFLLFMIAVIGAWRRRSASPTL